MQADRDELQRRIDKVTRLIANLCMSTCDNPHVEIKYCKGCINYGYIQILNILDKGE